MNKTSFLSIRWCISQPAFSSENQQGACFVFQRVFFFFLRADRRWKIFSSLGLMEKKLAAHSVQSLGPLPGVDFKSFDSTCWQNARIILWEWREEEKKKGSDTHARATRWPIGTKTCSKSLLENGHGIFSDGNSFIHVVDAPLPFIWLAVGLWESKDRARIPQRIESSIGLLHLFLSLRQSQSWLWKHRGCICLFVRGL
jgi:hypothetical protein